ncbi:MAG TPA: hypothetical protein VH475_11065 [Tepidisphaeraceae bacterium]|jgi:hypothetical protein
MMSNQAPQILDYVNGRERARSADARLPDSPLGRASCLICGSSIATTVFGAFLKHVTGEEIGIVGFVGFAAAILLVLCLVAGVPLALGGLASPGYRKRLAIIGLVANLTWLGSLVTVFWWIASHMD